MLKMSKRLNNLPNILVVEDHVPCQQLLGHYLKGIYNTYFAESVALAKEKLKGNSIDGVLLDLTLLGDEDGLELVKDMGESENALPVIATTGHAFATDREACIEAGCDDYLSKPLKRSDVLEKLGQYVPVHA